jgi:hypothetical protein
MQQVDDRVEGYLQPWTFANPGALRHALEEYTALLNESLVQQYGEKDGGDETDSSYERTIWRQRSAIDRGMDVLEETRPTWYRLIDMYYRHGLSADQKGWLIPMTRLGLRRAKCPPMMRCAIPRGEEYEDRRLELPKCRCMVDLHCQWDWDTFQGQLSRAIEALFRAIRDR